MTPEQWRKIKGYLQRALDVPPEDRSAFLDRDCPDPEMRREVKSLLESERQAKHFLTQGAAAYFPEVAAGDEAEDPNLGEQIGAYRVIRLIGTGGMGAVYLAERSGEFRQEVALKLLQPGMNSRLIVSRFLRERQILAGLEHPNIVHLLDGGTTEEKRPYVVMEYVAGNPINTYCASHDLSVPARLRLFRSVCAGVQYAHRNLVVHRDLKSSNILVTAEGIPKLLDFGIAKLLEQNPEEGPEGLTQTGFRLMTPEYASPEQVRGLPVTTATDVYSLGIVLFEMLTGQLPYRFESRSPSEMERAICEQEPRRPSDVVSSDRRIPRDLDKIVGKALEKDPHRRYESVEQFSADILRFLQGLPVFARPHTLFYRAGKFVRRNRLAVGAAVLAILSLIAGLVATLREARIAREERTRAEKRFNDVRKLANSFLFEFHDEIVNLPGTTRARHLVADRAREYLDSLTAEAGGDTKLETELAQAYLRLGFVQADTSRPSLGDGPAALASYDAAVRIAGKVLQKEPDNIEARSARASAWGASGRVFMLQGKSEEGIAGLREAIADYQTLVRIRPDEIKSRMELADSLGTLALIVGAFGYPSLGDIDEAEPLFRESIKNFDEILAREPQNQQAKISRASQMLHLGNLLWKGRGRPNAALPIWKKTLAELEASERSNLEALNLISSVREMMGWATVRTNPVQALEEYRQAVAIMEKLSSADPRDNRAQMGFAITLAHAGIVQSEIPGQHKAALASFARALQMGIRRVPGDPRDMQLDIGEAEVEVRIARLLFEAGAKEEARKRTERALATLKQIGDATSVPNYLGSCAWALLNAEPRELRDSEKALRYAQIASAAAKGHNVEYLSYIADAHFQVGRPDKAVETERMILSLIPPDATDREEYERKLKEYQSSTFPRQP
jgi:serine/threonine protein kinase/tetratricopeptide (TPR) repeat protein